MSARLIEVSSTTVRIRCDSLLPEVLLTLITNMAVAHHEQLEDITGFIL
jgi:hypothetical protein